MNYKYFTNKSCEFYPCHDIEDINCLFCYCPLYSIKNCGGGYDKEKGFKDCSGCTFPHKIENYDKVIYLLKLTFI